MLRFGAGGVYSIEVSAEGPDGSESARALEEGARWTARRLPAAFEIVSAVNNSTLLISNDGAAEACISFSTHAVRDGEVRLEARSVGHGASVSKLGMRDESAVCSTVISETIEATATTNIGGVSNETHIELGDGVFGEQSRVECRADELWIYTPAPGVGEVTTLFRRR